MTWRERERGEKRREENRNKGKRIETKGRGEKHREEERNIEKRRET